MNTFEYTVYKVYRIKGRRRKNKMSSHETWLEGMFRAHSLAADLGQLLTEGPDVYMEERIENGYAVGNVAFIVKGIEK